MKKILLIEDDKLLIELYKKKLEGEGYVVEGAENGTTAISMLKKTSYDLVLLDIMLPEGGMNGFDVLEQIENDEVLKKIPVIVFTNLDTEEQSALKIGARAYMVKGNTTPNEIVEKIKEFI